MVDLIEVAKSLRAKAVLAARVDAARASRSQCREVRAPYAVARPLTPHHPCRLEAPDLASGFEYRAPPVADNPAYHQTVDEAGQVLSYSHECADWQKAVPLTRPMTRTINPGRVAEVTGLACAADTADTVSAVRVPLRVDRARRRANLGRGAEVSGHAMLITDRPIAAPRPAYTRRHAHIYALARSANYVSAMHALKEAILQSERDEKGRAVSLMVVNRRRHLAEARKALGDTLKHHQCLSERFA